MNYICAHTDTHTLSSPLIFRKYKSNYCIQHGFHFTLRLIYELHFIRFHFKLLFYEKEVNGSIWIKIAAQANTFRLSEANQRKGTGCEQWDEKINGESKNRSKNKCKNLHATKLKLQIDLIPKLTHTNILKKGVLKRLLRTLMISILNVQQQ